MPAPSSLKTVLRRAILVKRDKNSYQRAEAAGRHGEALAVIMLRLKGYKIIKHRFKTKIGEIDIIAQKGRADSKVIIFVEVKHRVDLTAALYSVTDVQTRRIEAAAELFMAYAHGLEHCAWRFDIIVTGARLWPHHIKDAWRPD